MSILFVFFSMIFYFLSTSVEPVVFGFYLGDEWKLKIANNAALIRNFVKELQAENVVLEMCEERYNDEVYEIVSHPNYDKTFTHVHKLLDKNPERLLKFN